MCEIEHNRFKPDEVEKFRMGISEHKYWEPEARHLKDLLSDVILQNLLRKYNADNMLENWRKIAIAYRSRLRREGLSMQQVRESRLSIKD